MPPASHQVSATSLKLLIQQIHPRVRVERDSGMCVARDLYELWVSYSKSQTFNMHYKDAPKGTSVYSEREVLTSGGD